MNRFFCQLLLGMLVTLHVNAADTRPNIVFVLLDDLDAITSPYWDALPATRQLLQSRGVTFDQALAPTPICCPACSPMAVSVEDGRRLSKMVMKKRPWRCGCNRQVIAQHISANI